MSLLQADEPRLVLASASASRKALLKAAGLAFEARAAHIDEGGVKQACQSEGASAADAATLLAELKARRIARGAPDALVIGCDQLLVCGDRWFDKPVDMAQARQHLRDLRGQTHVLVTAVVCLRGENRVWHHVATPKLTMRPFGEAFLEAYLETEGEALLSCVGAYRLEAAGSHLFDAIDGEHSAILGLPLLPLFGFLRQHGVLLA